ncbi:hypothetical protein FF098_015065, partial [Parvularcula flava]|nr:hypothetical protein [Aquisalinus luteolus]
MVGIRDVAAGFFLEDNAGLISRGFANEDIFIVPVHQYACGCASCKEAQDRAATDIDPQHSAVAVDDFTSLLAPLGDDYYRWNWNGEDTQTGVTFVTYSFWDGGNLPYDIALQNGATSSFQFTEAQQAATRLALAEFADASGLVFIEVEEAGMLNFIGISGSDDVAGYAYYPSLDRGPGYGIYISGGQFTNFGVGTFEYTVVLHEIGHALGLKHPFEGDITLNPAIDDTETTVMSYNDVVPFVESLGPLDIDAVQFLYGQDIDPTAAGIDYSWDEATDTFTVTGSNNADTFNGVAGTNILRGMGGDDHILGANQNDILYGGAGDDFLDAWEGDNTVFGDEGDDTIVSNSYGSSVIHGGDGNDTIETWSDNDELHGDAGDDIFYIDRLDQLTQIFGGEGFDSVSFQHASGLPTAIVPSLSTWSSIERIIATETSDYLDGSSGDDYIDGAGGDDTLAGRLGNDRLDGGAGDDYLISDVGSDLISGGDGFDSVSFQDRTSGVNVLYVSSESDLEVLQGWTLVHGIEQVFDTEYADLFIGSTGDDIFTIGRGGDSYDGKQGNDSLVFGSEFVGFSLATGLVTKADSSHTVSARNIETLVATSGMRLEGTIGTQTLMGSEGNDILSGLAGNDRLVGGDYGPDLADYSNDYLYGGTSAVNIDLRQQTGVDGFGNVDTYIGIEGVIGTRLDDTLTGNSDNNVLRGEDGNDQISGREGDDILYGGAGTNILRGGDGDDEIYAEGTGDQLFGDAGNDTFYLNNDSHTIQGGDGFDTASFGESWDGIVISVTAMNLAGIETLVASQAADIVYAGADAMTIYGAAGDDIIYGSDADNRLNGGWGVDLIVSGSGREEIDGGYEIGWSGDYLAFQDILTGVYVNLLTGEGRGGDAEGDTYNRISGVYDTEADDTIIGNSRGTTFFFSGGNDYYEGYSGGRSDTDTLRFSKDIGPITMDLSSGDYFAASASGLNVLGGLQLVSIERVLIEESYINNDTLLGRDGLDVFGGGGGNDSLSGRGGDDELSGNNGDDVLIGGSGVDWLDGGAGYDTADYSSDSGAGGSGRIFADLSAGTIIDGFGDADTVISIENVIAGSNGDELVGSAARDTLFGMAGNDFLAGRDGNDVLDGGDGDDRMFGEAGADLLRGGLGNDYLVGNDGNDVLVGGDGADNIQGRDGDDRLFGEGGHDRILGGTGNDYLVGNEG